MAVDVTITRGYRNPNYFNSLNPQSGYIYYQGGSTGSPGISAHNQLQGIQGLGTAYYHLDVLQYEELAVWLSQMEMDSAHNQVESITLYGSIYFNNAGESSGGHMSNFIYWGDTGDVDTYIQEYTDDVLRVVCNDVLVMTLESDKVTMSVSTEVTADLNVTGDFSIDSSPSIGMIETTLTDSATRIPTSSAVFAAIALEDIWDRTSDGVITPATSTDPIMLFSNIYFENNVSTSHLPRYIYWGDPTDGWDTYIYESADDVLKIFAGGTEVITFAGGGITLLTGATVNTIETTLTDDDTHIPTSGAVFAYAATIAHTHRLDEVTNPNTGKTFTMSLNQLRFLWTAPVTADGALELEVTGAFTGDVLHIHQHTGAPGAGTHLVHLEAANTDVMPLYVDAAGTISAEFTKAIKTDTINEFNTDAGVTIESLKIEDGTLYTAITNMTFQDGSVGPYTLTELAAGGASYWDRDSSGVLSPSTSGDDIEMTGGDIFASDGSASHGTSLGIYAGDADGATNDGGAVIIRGGDAVLADSSSAFGPVYISPGTPYATNIVGRVYIGDSNYTSTAIGLRSEGSATNVNFYVESKGSTSSLYLYGGNYTVIRASTSVQISGNTLQFGANTADYVTFKPPSAQATYPNVDMHIEGGKAYVVGDVDGGHVMIYGGEPAGSGTRGEIYFGDGTFGTLQNDEAETNVVGYDTATGLLTYMSVPSGGFGGGDAYWDRSSAGVLTTDTPGDEIELGGDLYFSITSGPQVSNIGSSGTVPNIHPRKTDLTSGIGSIGTGYVSIICTSTELFRVGASSIKAFQEIEPATTGNISLGSTGLYWGTVYATQINFTDVNTRIYQQSGQLYFYDSTAGGIHLNDLKNEVTLSGTPASTYVPYFTTASIITTTSTFYFNGSTLSAPVLRATSSVYTNSITEHGSGVGVTIENITFKDGGVAENLLPTANDTYDLGNSSFFWRRLYITDYIFVGDANTYISYSGGELMFYDTTAGSQSLSDLIGGSAFPGSGGIEWSGTTSNAIGTYVDSNTIQAESTLLFDATKDQLYIDRNFHGDEGLSIYVDGPNISSSTTNNDRGITVDLRQAYAISGGITDSGYRIGINIISAVNDAGFSGNLDEQFGLRIQYGSLSSSSTGTITDTYGLYLEENTAGSATLTNMYSIYSSGSAYMVHNGHVAIGTTTPSATYELYVNGNIYATGEITFEATEATTANWYFNNTSGTGVARMTVATNDGGVGWYVQIEQDGDGYFSDETDNHIMDWDNDRRVSAGKYTSIDTESSFTAFNSAAAEFAATVYNANTGNTSYGLKIRLGAASQSSGVYVYLSAQNGSSTEEGGLRNNDGTFEVYQGSDRRLKTNIVETEIDAAAILNALRVRDYNRVGSGHILSPRQTGWIAQEVEKVYSVMYGYNEGTDLHTVSPSELIPVLHRGWQLHEERLETHEEKIIRLENRVTFLESQLNFNQNEN